MNKDFTGLIKIIYPPIDFDLVHFPYITDYWVSLDINLTLLNGQGLALKFVQSHLPPDGQYRKNYTYIKEGIQMHSLYT